jgi:hypothetical protein
MRPPAALGKAFPRPLTPGYLPTLQARRIMNGDIIMSAVIRGTKATGFWWNRSDIPSFF